ncbi:MAG: hypothetical protein PWP65_1853 [Clostridia bacterium]|nr:hypothetical protein [Clostridia bacterium]
MSLSCLTVQGRREIKLNAPAAMGWYTVPIRAVAGDPVVAWGGGAVAVWSLAGAAAQGVAEAQAAVVPAAVPVALAVAS